MKRFGLFTFYLLIIVSFSSCAQKHEFAGSNPAPSHQLWTELLGQHVTDAGWVSYSTFQTDTAKLNEYLDMLSLAPPNAGWSENEKLAYWINAYNAFTIKLILNHYPVTGIKQIKKGISFINSVWDIKFIQIGNQKLSLNIIEHQILRKAFDEPRIHFAIVCASISCPSLLNTAFEAPRLNQQLTSQAIRFINDSTKNVLNDRHIQISPIFKWFKSDFTKNGTLQEYIKPFARQNFMPDARVSYTNYDWGLNGE